MNLPNGAWRRSATAWGIATLVVLGGCAPSDPIDPSGRVGFGPSVHLLFGTPVTVAVGHASAQRLVVNIVGPPSTQGGDLMVGLVDDAWVEMPTGDLSATETTTIAVDGSTTLSLEFVAAQAVVSPVLVLVHGPETARLLLDLPNR